MQVCTYSGGARHRVNPTALARSRWELPVYERVNGGDIERATASRHTQWTRSGPVRWSDSVSRDLRKRHEAGARRAVHTHSCSLYAAGSVTSMTVPFSLSTSRTDPPMARAKDSTIDMPKPDEPRPSRVREESPRTKRSNTRSRMSAGMPGPSSATRIVIIDEAWAPVALPPPFAEPRRAAEAATASCRPELRGAVDAVGAALTDVLSGASEAKIVVAGAANLARGALDFRDIAPVLDALEEQVVLMRLFSEADPGEDLHVSIGAENPHDALAEAAVVTGTYRAGADENGGSAHLGIVGPMRMDYARTMSSVRAVAAYLSRYLAQENTN